VRASTRLDHSLGVAGLGLRVGDGLQLAPAELRLLVAACLLHDIGHYPLSHAAEPGFARALGVAHHGVSEWIVRGNGAIPRAESMRPALERAGLDPDLLWSIIAGAAAPPHAALSRLLLAPINLDTLDGIVRTARSFGRRGMKLPDRLFRRDGEELLLDPDAIPALDRFWALKDRMYGEIINLPSNIVAEAELSRAVADRFDRAVFGGFAGFDDVALRGLADAAARAAGLLAGADDRFRFAGRRIAGDDLPRVRKRYFVDHRIAPGDAGLAGPDWTRRYRHGRQLVYVTHQHAAIQLPLPGLVSFADAPNAEAWSQLPAGAEGPEI
jgi:HD superfamily phosphohydrolase